MKCQNCQGEKVFRNLDCIFCSPKHANKPNPDCRYCHGRGTYDNPCDYCRGTGKVPDKYIFRFINEGTGKSVVMTFDLAIANQYLVAAEDHLYLPVDSIFEADCKMLGVSRETHFMYLGGQLLEFGWIFQRLNIYPPRGKQWLSVSVERRKQQAAEALARHFAWYWRKGNFMVMRVRFVPRKSTEELLEALWQKVSAKGYFYEFRVWEGNIATGERGWSLLVRSNDDEKRGAMIGIGYDIEIAIQEGLGAVDKVIAKLEKKKK